jgi:Ca2+-transporting ATPase
MVALSRPNPALRWVLVAVIAMLSLTLLVPVASALFRFGPLHWNDLAVTIAAGVVVLIVLEFAKSMLYGRNWQQSAAQHTV